MNIGRRKPIRTKLISLFSAGAFALFAFGLPALAQPHAGAQVYSSRDLAAQLEELAQKAKTAGSSGSTLGDFTSHAIKLSVRTSSGGAEVHAHFDDIFFVTGGSATLITGGHVIHAKTSADGETKGSGIAGGVRRTIHKGDVVHIPAGTPHQLLIPPGTTYSSIVIKVRE